MMKTHAQEPFHKNRGMVLIIITLSVVVLLTTLIVAFFAASGVNRNVENASSNAVSAQMLAQGAIGAIEAEFIDEIIQGSEEPPSGNQKKVYYPKSSANMVPERSVYVPTDSTKADFANFANVIKQSGRDFRAGSKVFSLTSSHLTDAPAASGRKINPANWGAPMLTGGDFVSATAPRWIYVNANGYSATPVAGGSANPTIGRIAFNVYDIGGLIDINASGHASDAPAELMANKGTPAAIDLTMLPGINPQASAASKSVSWPPTWRLRGEWKYFNVDPDGDRASSFYTLSGWLQPFMKPNGGAGDRMFTSRQDLIRYAKAYPDTFDPKKNPLQYLTTFSRDVEQPTHRPDPTRPKVQQAIAAGGNDAQGLDDQINPALASQTKADGTQAIKRRFPLSRLALVSTPIPPANPAGDAAKILEYFGLTWESANNWWAYNHGSATRILRLSDVPANRDPDFFELLKAALSVGALGKQYGFDFPTAYTAAYPASRLGGEDGRIEDQIVQIAANIIDQADADSYPTRIRFNGRTFYGIEDLPRIYRGREASYRIGTMPNFGLRPSDTSPTITSRASLYVTMIHPELWNPHRPSPSPAGPTPTNFRIVAQTYTPIGSEAAYLWNANASGPIANSRGGYWDNFSARPNGPNCSLRVSYTSGEGSVQPNAALTFNLGTGDASFREPRPLSAVGYPPGSNANGSTNAPDMALTALSNPGLPDTVVAIAENPVPSPLNGGTNYTNALGFVASYAPFINAGVLARWLNVMKGLGGPVAMELQYQVNGQWWTMDKMDVTYANELRFVHQQAYTAHRADPRSSRWGSIYAIKAGTAPTPNRYDTGYTANPSLNNFPVFTDKSSAQAPGWVGAAATWDIGRLQWNKNNATVRYTDPDGVLRATDAEYSSGVVGVPMITGNNTSRPVVLNRPFRSVAELGNVFRDTPWRSLDFMTPASGDRALLDVFCVDEMPEDTVVAGKVNLNTRHMPVIKALIRGASMATGTAIDETTAENAADALVNWTASTAKGRGPLRDRSELIGSYQPDSKDFSGPLQEMADHLVAADRPIKASREAIVRGLADVGTTRTWNVLIDIIAQSGQHTAAGFIPSGESRIWHSVAIDRFTAKIIEQSTETVQE